MEKYDIIHCQKDGRSTSANYVVLEVHKNGKPKNIIQLTTWYTYEDEDRCLRDAMFLGSSEDFPWVVIDKVDVSVFTAPHYKVIRKIKLMNTKRKEQGYAF